MRYVAGGLQPRNRCLTMPGAARIGWPRSYALRGTKYVKPQHEYVLRQRPADTCWGLDKDLTGQVTEDAVPT